MLKRILTICTVAFAFSASAQFKVTKDTLYAEGFTGTQATDFVEIYGENHIISLSANDQIIRWERTVNEFSAIEWTSAVCDIVSCKAPETDTGSFLLPAGDTGYMSFHFYIKNVRGTGKMVVKFFREAVPTDSVNIVTFGTGWNPASIINLSASATSISPNPAKDYIIPNNSLIKEGRFELLNPLGQVVLSGEYINGRQIDLSGITSGVYSLKVANGVYSSSTKIVKD